MIYLVHNTNMVVSVFDDKFQKLPFKDSLSITRVLLDLARAFPEDLIIWCNEVYWDYVNHEKITKIFHHDYIIASYNVNGEMFIPDQIGYVDQSVFVNVNKKVSYPTWMMSSDVGGVSSGLLNSISKEIKTTIGFDYFLNSLAKMTMPFGVFCYSNPNLLRKNDWVRRESNRASVYDLFKFVKEHYKWNWTFVMLMCYFLFEKKLPVFPFIKTFCYNKKSIRLSKLNIRSNKKVLDSADIDVIIPTIGRKQYLYDVLKDLSQQTLLPKNVIIIEQNGLTDSKTELDYLYSEVWPFSIKHKFTNQTGACNARNLALKILESEWCFFADDDIRLSETLIEEAFSKIEIMGIEAISLSCLLMEQKQNYKYAHQTDIFGSGSSIVRSKLLKGVEFNLGYEFGYGEDLDYGMQLRNLGVDIVYDPDLRMLHLKAPVGGFRTKIKNQWDDDPIQPKPLPTIMFFFKNYATKFQMKGYKCILFFKFYAKQKLRNPFTYVSKMKKQWRQSEYWSNKLINRE